MAEQSEYARTLFVFNDDFDVFTAFLAGDREKGCIAGSASAAIRPLRCLEIPRAAGVPTGSKRKGGFTALTDDVKEGIDLSLYIIRSPLATGHYDQVVFSKDPFRETLGTGLLRVSEDVKQYIYDALMGLD